MKKLFVRQTCVALAVMCFMCIITPAYAASGEASPAYVPYDGEKSYFWRSKTGTPYVSSLSSYQLVYVGEKAQRDGETDSFSYAYSRDVTIGGTFAISSKYFEVDYNISIGSNRSYTISKTSAPLKKGEYVKIYYQEMRQVYPCYQYYIEKTWHVDFAENGNPIFSDTDKVIDVKIGYIYEPLMPRIKIEYYGSTTNLNRVVIESR